MFTVFYTRLLDRSCACYLHKIFPKVAKPAEPVMVSYKWCGAHAMATLQVSRYSSILQGIDHGVQIGWCLQFPHDCFTQALGESRDLMRYTPCGMLHLFKRFFQAPSLSSHSGIRRSSRAVGRRPLFVSNLACVECQFAIKMFQWGDAQARKSAPTNVMT